MTVLPIRIYPDRILTKKSKPVTDPKSPEIRELILDMLETLEKNNGVGLAAPQVGKSIRLSVIKVDGKTYILINPKLKSKSWKKAVIEEGCLSFPGMFIPVKRSVKVKAEALNKKGTKYEIKAEGLLAQALQHEIDHLDGVLFTERKSKIRSASKK